MVRVRHAASREPVGFNMTPMIDVVFQLIIFFLVSSHMSRQDSDVKLPLPIADQRNQRDDQDAGLVVIHVQQDGTMASAGRALMAEQLGEYLRETQSRAGGQLELRLRCHRQVPYRYIKPVLMEAARAGVWKVNFAVHSPRDAE